MVKCKVCGSEMTVDTSNVLLSSPPRYRAFCENCGDVRYVTWEERMILVNAEAGAIPIEWIKRYGEENWFDFGTKYNAITCMLEEWEKENERSK